MSSNGKVGTPEGAQAAIKSRSGVTEGKKNPGKLTTGSMVF